MKTKLIQFIHLTLCVAVLSFAPGCGSSNPLETSIDLAEGVRLEMVRIPNDLLFGKYEVTQTQWESVMGENPSKFKNPDNPVEQVSWDDCQKFLKKLNELPSVKESGLTFRLPNEDEWEFACRAGATGDYCRLADGTEITEETVSQVAWGAENPDGKTTHPVGQKMPNAFGLHDMNGNVCELTSTADGERRVFRGGSCALSAGRCKASRRSRERSSFRYGYLGFRLCAETEEMQLAHDKKMRKTMDKEAALLISNMVQIPGKSYMLGKFEVTQAEWKLVMGENPSYFKSKGLDDPLAFQHNPVEFISWDDCQKFLEKLNELPAVINSRLVFRLPTEEEWEFACRAGATGKYCKLANGNEITESTLGPVAWFEENSDHKTHPVGQMAPNAFGLYDMLGNVQEWTSTAVGENRIISGGCWAFSAENCESSVQDCASPSGRGGNVGFRLCADRKK